MFALSLNCLTFVLILVVTVTVPVPSVFSECRDIKAVGLNDAWYVELRHWFVPMADEINQAELFGLSAKSMGVGGPNTMCFAAKVQTSGAPLAAPIGYTCAYTIADSQICQKTDTTSLDKTIFKSWPQQLSIKIVATDNSTYGLMSGCFGGQLDTWVLMSTTAEASADAQKIAETMFPKKEKKPATSFRFDSADVITCGKGSGPLAIPAAVPGNLSPPALLG